MKKVVLAVVVLAAVGGGAYWYVNQRAQTLVDERLADMVASGAYTSAEYEALRVGLNGDIHMQNLKLVQGPLDLTLQDITVSNLDYANEFPRHVDVAIDGLRLAPLDPYSADPAEAALAGMMANFPVDEEIPMELNYSYRYEPDNAFQTDSTMQMSLPGFFTLDASSTTRNIRMETLHLLNDSDPEIAQQQLLALMQTAEVPSMQMTLQDHGFLDGILAMAAQQNGVSPEDFRTLLTSQVQNFYLFLPQNAQGFAMTAGAEMAEFLQGGRTISVSVAPEYGGSVQRLQQEIMGATLTGDFTKVSELLHLQINTN